MFSNNSSKSQKIFPENLASGTGKSHVPEIHTMRGDLENIERGVVEKPKREVSPNPVRKPEKTEKEEKPKEPEKKVVVPEASKGASPFLSQSNWAKKEIPKRIKPEFKENKPEHHGLGKVIGFAIVIAVILLLVAGGYYFWMTKMGNREVIDMPSVTSILNDIPGENDPEPEVEVLPEFSSDQPNYLVVDVEDLSKDEIGKIFREKAGKIYEAQIASPVEFIVTDAANTPVDFRIFAEKTDIALSESVLEYLEETFSLYIYNDNGRTRLGMVVFAKDEAQLKNALLKEEDSLVQAMEPLYLETDYTIEKAKFKTSDYDGIEIRYTNIKSPQELSVDYTVGNNQLALGTTQMTLRSILDYIKQRSEIGDEMENDETGELEQEF